MKILFITADRCDDSELFYPYYRLLEEDFEIDIASFQKTKISAKYHFEIAADLSVDDVNGNDYDALLLPGGMAPEKLRQNEKVLSIVNCCGEAVQKNRPVIVINNKQGLKFSGICTVIPLSSKVEKLEKTHCNVLIKKSTDFNTTAMLKKYGTGYGINNIYDELGCYGDCLCIGLFPSNRQKAYK